MKKMSVLLLVVLLYSCAATYYCRYPATRWLRDNDRNLVSFDIFKKRKMDIFSPDTDFIAQMNTLIGFSEHLSDLASLPAKGHREALNVNNFDEVADSTWFTNRIGRFGAMSPKEDITTFKKPLTILKAILISDGECIIVAKDPSNKFFIIRLDPPGREEKKTGAEIIGSRLLYAIGYNTLRSRLLDFRASDFLLNDSSKIFKNNGSVFQFEHGDLNDIFKTKKQRGVVLELPSVGLLGPFAFRGKFKGDINDRIVHDYRRELRGFRVFASFLNIVNAGEDNAIDVFIPVIDDKGYVKHYITDFSSALDNVPSQDSSDASNNEYRRSVGALFSLGFYDPYWTRSDVSKKLTAPFDASEFKPEKWQPAKSNPAFREMTYRDALWAAKILMRISNDDIKDVVNEGSYSDPEYEKYLIKNLIARRDAICRYWFSKLNPLDNFEIVQKGDSYLVRYNNLAVDGGFEKPDTIEYRSILKTTNAKTDLTQWMPEDKPIATIDVGVLQKMRQNEIYALHVQSKHKNDRWWRSSIDVFIKKKEGLEILGIKRRYSH